MPKPLTLPLAILVAAWPISASATAVGRAADGTYLVLAADQGQLRLHLGKPSVDAFDAIIIARAISTR